MKKSCVFAVFMLVLALVAGCDKKQDTKAVAIVNISQVFQESEAAKAGMKYLESIGNEMQNEFLALQQELEKDPNNAEKQKKFNDALTAFQGRLNAEQQQVLTRINDTFQQVVDSYREKNKIAVILRSDQVVSMDPAFDVTNDIVKEMNKLELTFTPIEPAKPKDKPALKDSQDTKDKIVPETAQGPAASSPKTENANAAANPAEKPAQKENVQSSGAQAVDAKNDNAKPKKK